MNYRNLYKSRPVISAAGFSAKFSQALNAERQEKQIKLFWGSRIALVESTSPKPQVEAVKKKNLRAEMLKKWKAEKMKKLEEEKKNKKPIFKVGVVKKTATGSPLISQPKTYMKKNVGVKQTHPEPETSEQKRSGVITRAKVKKMGVNVLPPETKPVVKTQKPFNKCYKYEGGKRKQIDSHVFKVPEAVAKLPCSGLTFPCSPKHLRRSQIKPKTIEKEDKVDTTKTKKVEVKSVKKVKEKPVKSKPTEIENEVKDSSKENKVEEEVLQTQVVTPEKVGVETDGYMPIYYSPYVSVRKGKRSSRRKSKKSLTLDIDEQIKKEENVLKCRIFSFRKYIECETKRLLDQCDKWKQIYLEFEEVPPDVEGDIDSVTGKTKLLTSDKFMQFKGLIDKCENGDPLVKVDDLQGFQDWVSIEVEKLDEEFYKLENRKCNNWKSEDSAPVNDVKIQKAVKKGTKKPAAKSQIRSHILAARKLLKEGNANGGEKSQLPTLAFELPVKPMTPVKKESLLKDVLHSETKKKLSSVKKSPLAQERRNSGLEIMIASQKNKFPTPMKLQKSPLLSDYEIFVGDTPTPSKSILKKTPKTLNSSKGRVKFENQSENLIENEPRRGLSEKYFQPVVDDEDSPIRTVLRDLRNVSSEGMKTRSRSRQLSYSSLMNQQVM